MRLRVHHYKKLSLRGGVSLGEVFQRIRGMSRRRTLAAIICSLLVGVGACWFISSRNHSFSWRSSSGVLVAISVPGEMDAWPARGKDGRLSNIIVNGELKYWKEASEKNDCNNEGADFFKEIEKIRKDRGLTIYFYDKPNLKKSFESGVFLWGEEKSIVVNTQKKSGIYLVDTSGEVDESAFSFAECYYAAARSWYCGVFLKLGPHVVGKFGLPAGQFKSWPRQIAVMKCAFNSMIKAAAS